jgi:hypothetical protein
LSYSVGPAAFIFERISSGGETEDES